MYYRHSVPAASPAQRRLPAAIPVIPDGTHAPLEEVESASAAQIVDSSSEQLLAEIREKRRASSLTPVAVGALLILLVFSFQSSWLFGLTAVVGLAAIVAARYRDRIREDGGHPLRLRAGRRRGIPALHGVGTGGGVEPEGLARRRLGARV